ncbi:MAG: helix-turn-helix domain-containing protein [Chloroflexi bacterium]|nr:helix-turn-helix domain-containing protein [Chloroflexota bacterium]MCL5107924.1 helix-turn-helix domain-containing protein [Chloroflexota bacterium]
MRINTEALKIARIQQGMTQSDLAGRVGVHVSTICRLELGKQLGTKTLKRVADALNLPMDQVVAA